MLCIKSIIHAEDFLEKELQGKTALVTGASRGIGAATAIALAKNGVSKIVIHFGEHRAGAEETLARVRAVGGDGVVMGGDLSTPTGIRAFLADLDKTVPEIDILINNAGA